MLVRTRSISASDDADEGQRLAPGAAARLHGTLASQPPRDCTTAAGSCPSDLFPPDAARPRAWLDLIGLRPPTQMEPPNA